MFCSKCGFELQDTMGFCSKCGASVQRHSEADVMVKSGAVAKTSTDEKLLKEYYQKIFKKYDDLISQYKNKPDNPSIPSLWSWNWPGFLFGGFWLLYKGQWKWFLFLVGWAVVIMIIPPLEITTLALWLGTGLWGNFYVYYTHKTKKVVVFKTPKKMFNELKNL